MTAARDSQEVKEFVKERYGRVARERTSCCGEASSTSDAGWEAKGLYSEKELAEVPREAAEASLGCGNPTAIAGLKEGEMVLDLGSGGGIDCLLAAQRVGPQGRVIGLDMTPDMVALARANATKSGMSNVEFRLGEMERMPLEDNSVDVIISNCVINLSTDKVAVFREAFRVLRPGGRLGVSDIVLLGKLPAKVARSLEQWAGCVAGALSQEDYRAKLEGAGFAGVSLERKGMAYPDYEAVKESLAALDITARSYERLKGCLASMDIRAYKPGG